MGSLNCVSHVTLHRIPVYGNNMTFNFKILIYNS